MREETIFDFYENRIFLITGETQDWYIGKDLAMIDFETFLAKYLHEIGYRYVIFRGGNEYRMKFVLDEESSRFAFPPKPGTESARKDSAETDGTSHVQNASAGGSARRRMPGQRRPGRHSAAALSGTDSVSSTGSASSGADSESNTSSVPSSSVSGSSTSSLPLSPDSGRNDAASADQTAMSGEMTPGTGDKNVQEQAPYVGGKHPVLPVKKESDAWKQLDYRNRRPLSQNVLLQQFKEYVSDSIHKNAVIFTDLDAFLSSDYYKSYMEVLTQLVNQPSRDENIVIFIAHGYDLKMLEQEFIRRPDFARMFAEIGSEEGSGLRFNSKRVLQLGLPGQDEFVRLLEHMRIVGVRDRSVAGLQDIKGSIEDVKARTLRLDYDLKDLEKLASTLRFYCYEEAQKDSDGGQKKPLLTVEAKIARYMRDQLPAMKLGMHTSKVSFTFDSIN
ncbi:MAG: hypothetical protein LUI87_13210, partial [Lachnospiraceae bacterium]|nr:hypothetical protein [Lachnospiraceae bacterium]